MREGFEYVNKIWAQEVYYTSTPFGACGVSRSLNATERGHVTSSNQLESHLRTYNTTLSTRMLVTSHCLMRLMVTGFRIRLIPCVDMP